MIDPIAHYGNGLFIITLFVEKTFGKVNTELIARKRQGDRAASAYTMLEIRTLSAGFIFLRSSNQPIMSLPFVNRYDFYSLDTNCV